MSVHQIIKDFENRSTIVTTINKFTNSNVPVYFYSGDDHWFYIGRVKRCEIYANSNVITIVTENESIDVNRLNITANKAVDIYIDTFEMVVFCDPLITSDVLIKSFLENHSTAHLFSKVNIKESVAIAY